MVTIHVTSQTPGILMALTARGVESISQSELRDRVLAIFPGAALTPTEVAKLEDKYASHVCRTIRELEAQGLAEVAWSESRESHYGTTWSGYALVLTLSQHTKRHTTRALSTHSVRL